MALHPFFRRRAVRRQLIATSFDDMVCFMRILSQGTDGFRDHLDNCIVMLVLKFGYAQVERGFSNLYTFSNINTIKV